MLNLPLKLRLHINPHSDQISEDKHERITCFNECECQCHCSHLKQIHSCLLTLAYFVWIRRNIYIYELDLDFKEQSIQKIKVVNDKFQLRPFKESQIIRGEGEGSRL